MKRIRLAALFLVALSFSLWPLVVMIVGCDKTTLAPVGVYGTNTFWYQADAILLESKDDLGAFVFWTRNNAVQLKQQHLDSMIVSAEAIRTNAPVWFKVAYQARDAYTNALFGGSSAVTLTDSSNALFSALTAIQTQVTLSHTLTNTLTP